MSLWGSGNPIRPAPGSLLERHFAGLLHPDPQEFGCGVRIVRGAVPGESLHWRFRRSALDRFEDGATQTLYHGRTALVLQLPVVFPAAVPDRPRRNGHALFEAREQRTGAELLLSVMIGQLDRFGITSL